MRIVFNAACGALFFFAAMTIGSAAKADDAPTGRVILEVSGNIEHTNGDGVMRYNLEMLDALGNTTINTESPWTEGIVEYQGVLVRDILAYTGAKATSVNATALNDYTVTIPASDFQEYDVILATRRDGEVLSVRDRGPVWIIYPWTDQPNLQNEVIFSRSIWQLKSLFVE